MLDLKEDLGLDKIFSLEISDDRALLANVEIRQPNAEDSIFSKQKSY